MSEPELATDESNAWKPDAASTMVPQATLETLSCQRLSSALKERLLAVADAPGIRTVLLTGTGDRDEVATALAGSLGNHGYAYYRINPTAWAGTSGPDLLGYIHNLFRYTRVNADNGKVCIHLANIVQQLETSGNRIDLLSKLRTYLTTPKTGDKLVVILTAETKNIAETVIDNPSNLHLLFENDEETAVTDLRVSLAEIAAEPAENRFERRSSLAQDESIPFTLEEEYGKRSLFRSLGGEYLTADEVLRRHRDDSVEFQTAHTAGYLIDGELYAPRNGQKVREPLPERFVDRIRTHFAFELTYSSEGTRRSAPVAFPGTLSSRTILLASELTFKRLDGFIENEIDVAVENIQDLSPLAFDDLPDRQAARGLSAIEDCLDTRPTAVPWEDIPQLLRTASNRSSGSLETSALELVTTLLESPEKHGSDEFATLVERTISLLEAICTDDFDGLGELATGTMNARCNALDELQRLGEAYPSLLEPHTETLVEIVDSGETIYQVSAAQCLTAIAEERPAAVLDAVPALAAVVADEDGKAQSHAVYTLLVISKEYPEEILPAVGALTDTVRDGNEKAAASAMMALGQVIQSYPVPVEQIAGAAVELFTADRDEARMNAVALLGDIAEHHPEAVIPYAEELARRMVDDDREEVRFNAVLALNQAGEVDPGRIQRQSEALSQALGDSSQTVRMNACVLIRNAIVPVDEDELERVANEDPHEEVRKWANRALRRVR